MAHETIMTANEKANHFLGGYWKCEGCGLLIEDTLYVCPECLAKKELDSYIEINGIMIDQQDEMSADQGKDK